jgi:RNA polymerase sigma-70 factor (ECF subfamily)
MTDKFNKLASRLKNGDRRAAEKIFDYFSPQIFRYFVVRIRNRETAEDLTQEVFLKLVEKIRTFDENLGAFSGWFWQVAKNTVKDYYRKSKSFPLSDLMLQSKEKKDFLEGQGKLADEIKIKEILEMIKEFDEEEQEVFSLHYLSDLSYKEMAKALGKSEGALRVCVHRINQKIKRMIF